MRSRKGQVRVVHLAAPAGRDITPAPAYERPDPLGITFFVHIVERSDHHTVRVECTLHINHVNVNAHLPQRSEKIQKCFQVIQIIIHSIGVLHRPPVLPVKYHGDPWAVAGADHLWRDLFQALTQPCHLAKYPCIRAVSVVDHRAMELLAGSPALSPLKILHAVRAACHCLQRGQRMHSRPF